MGYSYSTNKGNRITLQDDGSMCVTPKNGSTLFYNVDEVVSGLEYLREQGFYIHRDEEGDLK